MTPKEKMMFNDDLGNSVKFSDLTDVYQPNNPTELPVYLQVLNSLKRLWIEFP